MNQKTLGMKDMSKGHVQPGLAWWKGVCGIVLASMLTIAGCTVGPNYRPPESVTPTAWAGTTDVHFVSFSSNKIMQQTSAINQWWTHFKDPRLDSLVSRAVATNLDLKLAESRVRQSRAQWGVQFSGYWPAVDATGGYQHSRANQNQPTVNLYKAGLDASWELDVFGGTRRAVEAANADIVASLEDQRDVLVTLLSEVAVNYINLRSLQQQLNVAKENLAAQEQSVDLTRKLFSGGFSSKLSVANAEAEVATTRSQIPLLEASIRQAIFSLSVLLAREPSALLAELSTEAPIPLTPPEVPVGLPSELLRRRPDIRRAEARLHSATAQIGVATADLFPKFSLTGSLGTSGNNSASLVKWDNRFYSVGPSVTWAIFDAGRIRSNIKVQNELGEQALLNYQKTLLTALSDVEGALVAYVKEQQRRQALAEAVTANQQAVSLSTQLYSQGQTDFLSVLIAQRSLFSSQDSLVQSDRNVATDLVAVYKALGGGWEFENQVLKSAN